jgi:hypothetical protein
MVFIKIALVEPEIVCQMFLTQPQNQQVLILKNNPKFKTMEFYVLKINKT